MRQGNGKERTKAWEWEWEWELRACGRRRDALWSAKDIEQTVWSGGKVECSSSGFLSELWINWKIRGNENNETHNGHIHRTHRRCILFNLWATVEGIGKRNATQRNKTKGTGFSRIYSLAFSYSYSYSYSYFYDWLPIIHSNRGIALKNLRHRRGDAAAAHAIPSHKVQEKCQEEQFSCSCIVAPRRDTVRSVLGKRGHTLATGTWVVSADHCESMREGIRIRLRVCETMARVE